MTEQEYVAFSRSMEVFSMRTIAGSRGYYQSLSKADHQLLTGNHDVFDLFMEISREGNNRRQSQSISRLRIGSKGYMDSLQPFRLEAITQGTIFSLRNELGQLTVSQFAIVNVGYNERFTAGELLPDVDGVYYIDTPHRFTADQFGLSSGVLDEVEFFNAFKLGASKHDVIQMSEQIVYAQQSRVLGKRMLLLS